MNFGVFFDLLGTEQPLWCKEQLSQPQPGLHMPEAPQHDEIQSLPSAAIKQMSRLSSLRCDLREHGRVCIHRVLQPTGLHSSAPPPRGASRPTSPAGLGAVAPGGTGPTGWLCQCYGRWVQSLRSIPCFNTVFSPSAEDIHLSYSRPLELKKP